MRSNKCSKNEALWSPKRPIILVSPSQLGIGNKENLDIFLLCRYKKSAISSTCLKATFTMCVGSLFAKLFSPIFFYTILLCREVTSFDITARSKITLWSSPRLHYLTFHFMLYAFGGGGVTSLMVCSLCSYVTFYSLLNEKCNNAQIRLLMHG